MFFIYEMRIKRRTRERLRFTVFITTTTVCVSELNVLLCILLVANENICIWRWLPREHEVSLSQRAHTSLSLSLCASALFSEHVFSVKTQICCNYKYSRNHSTAIVFILCVAYLILSYDGSIIRIFVFVQINILEGRSGVLMVCVSVTISYSSCCLTTETVKYTNENSFIENLAASKYSMWHRAANKCNNK